MAKQNDLPTGEPADEHRWLVAALVDFYRDVLAREFDGRTGRFTPLDGREWDIRHNYAMVVPARLYRLKHPANPFYRSPDVLRMCVGAGTGLATVQDRFGRFPEEGVFGCAEWPAYYLARCSLMLAGRLDGDCRRRWLRAVEAYMNYHFPKSFLTGAPNHNAWRCLALYVGGKAIGSKRWMARGLWSAHQLAAGQYPDGIWEEPQRHHGISVHYLGGITRPMTILAGESGDRLVAEMAGRTRDFLIRFSQPDGGTLGCLDSRSSAFPFQFNVGFAGSPQGRRLNRLSLLTMRRLGMDSIVGSAANLHQAHAVAAALADSLPFWTAGRQTRLPQEADGYATRFDFGLLSAALSRHNGWTVGLNAGICEAKARSAEPREIDPQNRLDLWHESAGLIVGGGGGALPAGPADRDEAADMLHAMPLANVAIVTGYGDQADADCRFGVARANDARWIRGMFYPVAAKILRTGGSNVLRMDFTHARVNVTVRPIDAQAATIDYEIEQCGAKRILTQLPLAVMSGRRLIVDGRSCGSADGPPRCRLARRELRLSGGGAPDVVIQIPPAASSRVWWPLPGFIGFSRAMISSQINRPAPRVAISYRLAVADC